MESDLERYCHVLPEDSATVRVDKSLLRLHDRVRSVAERMRIPKEVLAPASRLASVMLLGFAGYEWFQPEGISNYLMAAANMWVAFGQSIELAKKEPTQSVIGELQAVLQTQELWRARSPWMYIADCCAALAFSALYASASVHDAPEVAMFAKTVTTSMLGLWAAGAGDYLKIQNVRLSDREREYLELPINK